jgi:hypothetical protein
LCAAFILARPSSFADRVPFSVAAAFVAAPYARFLFPRESNGPEHGAAFVANLASEASVIREKLVALLDC